MRGCCGAAACLQAEGAHVAGGGAVGVCGLHDGGGEALEAAQHSELVAHEGSAQGCDLVAVEQLPRALLRVVVEDDAVRVAVDGARAPAVGEGRLVPGGRHPPLLHVLGAAAQVELALARLVGHAQLERAAHARGHGLDLRRTDAEGAVHPERAALLGGRVAGELRVGLPQHGVVARLAVPLRRPDERLPRAVAQAHEVVELRGREQAAVLGDAADDGHPLERQAREARRVRARVLAQQHEALGAVANALGRHDLGKLSAQLRLRRVGHRGGVCLPRLGEHAAIGVHQLDAVVRLRVVRGRHHEADRQPALGPRAKHREHAHAVEGRVEELGLGAEAGCAVPQLRRRLRVLARSLHAHIHHAVRFVLRGAMLFSARLDIARRGHRRHNVLTLRSA